MSIEFVQMTLALGIFAVGATLFTMCRVLRAVKSSD